ncbi:hypothetical protein HZA41_03425 [Candidatus Peregrinibacteria bacterium]|nr:hypothetical protein [Candidatus Peregrinibacteria bacterium]
MAIGNLNVSRKSADIQQLNGEVDTAIDVQRYKNIDTYLLLGSPFDDVLARIVTDKTKDANYYKNQPGIKEVSDAILSLSNQRTLMNALTVAIEIKIRSL